MELVLKNTPVNRGFNKTWPVLLAACFGCVLAPLRQRYWPSIKDRFDTNSKNNKLSFAFMFLLFGDKRGRSGKRPYG